MQIDTMTSLFLRCSKPIYSLYFVHKHCFRKLLVNKSISYCVCNSYSTISHRFKTRRLHLNDTGKSDGNASKVKLISKLNFLSEEDAVPFYELSTRSLLQIYYCTKYDERMGFCKNRLYYISSRLKYPPEILSESISKRTFIYSLSFDWLESSLNVLIDMGVSSERIVRDLWVLKYHHKTIHERLQKVKSLGVETLYPWMVRCTEQILNRYIEILQETKNILGENQSTHVYLANRLNISPKDVEQICEKVPALRTIRVTKLKSFLDFLISEGFAIEDIARRPRVLTASQKTIKQRLEKLRSLGLKEINLNTLSRSKKDFKKYYASLESISSQNS